MLKTFLWLWPVNNQICLLSFGLNIKPTCWKMGDENRASCAEWCTVISCNSCNKYKTCIMITRRDGEPQNQSKHSRAFVIKRHSFTSVQVLCTQSAFSWPLPNPAQPNTQLSGNPPQCSAQPICNPRFYDVRLRSRLFCVADCHCGFCSCHFRNSSAVGNLPKR